MKASELRIGNLLLNFSGYSQKVDGDDLKVWDKSGIPKGIKPIPLTEEWLIKLGIDNNKEIDDFPVWIKKGFGSIELYGGGESRHELKYVHQLQNLYFALTGKELTTK